MHRGIDTCAPISAAQARQIRADGFTFVGRYLVPESGTTRQKALSKAEARRICDAGLRILTVWETEGDRAKDGAEAGRADGAAAAKLARKLQLPPEAIIYFAVDYDARTSVDIKAIRAYLTAARAQTGPWEIGVYGSYDVVTLMHGSTPCRGYWQCVAWSYGQWSPVAGVCQTKWQRDPECLALAERWGVAVDVDECEDMDAAGIWTYSVGADAPGSPKKEDTMTDKEVYEALQRHLGTQPVPRWAVDELAEAQALGITDGTRPMELIPRYQAAIMAKRAVHAVLQQAQPMDDKAVSGLLTDD